MDAMVDRSRTVNGKPTSLADLGYSDVGLDDAWQLCGALQGAAHARACAGPPTPPPGTIGEPVHDAPAVLARPFAAGAYGPGNSYHYHDASGNPIVNTTRFPDMTSMVDYGHSLNLTVGCACLSLGIGRPRAVAPGSQHRHCAWHAPMAASLSSIPSSCSCCCCPLPAAAPPAAGYHNNCICGETNKSATSFYAGDVAALVAFGYDSVKLDGCVARPRAQP